MDGEKVSPPLVSNWKTEGLVSWNLLPLAANLSAGHSGVAILHCPALGWSACHPSE
jgi:hypothetical protein